MLEKESGQAQPKNRVVVSFAIYNAYKSKAKLAPNSLVKIKIDHPLSRKFIPWVTTDEAGLYAKIIENGDDFWHDDFGELDFTLMDGDVFDQWYATL